MHSDPHRPSAARNHSLSSVKSRQASCNRFELNPLNFWGGFNHTWTPSTTFQKMWMISEIAYRLILKMLPQTFSLEYKVCAEYHFQLSQFDIYLSLPITSDSSLQFPHVFS